MAIIGSLACGLFFQQLFTGNNTIFGAFASPAVIILLLLIGIQMGADCSWLKGWRMHLRTTIIICAGTIAGSLLFGGLYALFDPALALRDSMLVTSGLGFYSLSSIILNREGLHHLALLALITNVLREVISLAAVPLIVRFFGALAPIAATASASDSGAPVITYVTGSQYTALCVGCAFVLSLAVPLLMQLLLWI